VEGDKVSVDLGNCGWLDETIVGELRRAISERAAIKRKEDELKGRKDDVNYEIAAYLDSLNIQSATLQGVGAVAKYSSGRAVLNQNKLKEGLLAAGVKAEVIISCFEKATSLSRSDGVRFTSAQGGEE